MTRLRAPTLASYDADPDAGLLASVRSMYAEVYAEPPYCEGAGDVVDFAEQWPARTIQPGFRLVLARIGDDHVGFAFGFRLRPDTDWWDGLLDPVPPHETAEDGKRTFVIIELAVRAPYRLRRIGHALHTTLLAHRPEKRVALLCRPEARPAQAAYASWGYRALGRLRPAKNLPVYSAMVRDLPVQDPLL